MKPVHEQVEEWRQAKLITRAQAAAILAHEEPVPGPPLSPWLDSPWAYAAAAVLPLVFGFFSALILFDLTAKLEPRGTQVESGVAFLMVALGVALAVWGWTRRHGHGALGLVAGASLMASIGYVHPSPTWWMVLPAPLLLAGGLGLGQPPPARLANSLLFPLAVLTALGAFGLDSGSTLLAVLAMGHGTATWLVLAPEGQARRWVAVGLLLLASSATVLGVYFLAIAPTLPRLGFVLVAGGIAALFLAMLRHPRLRRLALRPAAS